MNCPICGKNLINEACPSCGYDRTIDREEFPTLCWIAGREPAKSARIAKNLITPISNELADMEKRLAAVEATLGTLENSIRTIEEKLQNINPKQKQSRFAKASVGSKIIFGSYWQDKDKTKGKEAIDWRVLAKEDNKILVISDKALDCKPYNASCTAVTWETCSLREWLNGTFLNNAFSPGEQAQILSTKVLADKNPKQDTSHGNATVDRVFLLSITEAGKYFSSDEDRMCVPTAYAMAQEVYTNSHFRKDGAVTCLWWLRSPGLHQNYAAGVYLDGSVDSYGAYVNYDCDCVRPAVWISIDV